MDKTTMVKILRTSAGKIVDLINITDKEKQMIEMSYIEADIFDVIWALELEEEEDENEG